MTVVWYHADVAGFFLLRSIIMVHKLAPLMTLIAEVQHRSNVDQLYFQLVVFNLLFAAFHTIIWKMLCLQEDDYIMNMWKFLLPTVGIGFLSAERYLIFLNF